MTLTPLRARLAAAPDCEHRDWTTCNLCDLRLLLTEYDGLVAELRHDRDPEAPAST